MHHHAARPLNDERAVTTAPIRPACRAAAVLALTTLALLPIAARAQSDVTVTGSFSSFQAYIGTDRTSYVNGVALVAGTSTRDFNGTTLYLSDPVAFASTSSLTFTYDPALPSHPTPNTMAFAGGAADVVVGQVFDLGSFTFTNGQWWQESFLSFELLTHSADARLDGHTFTGILDLVTVNGPGPAPKPEQEADFFFLVDHSELGSARVYDTFNQPASHPGNQGSFAFVGRIDSLVPTGFRSLDGAGFTNSSIDRALAITGSRAVDLCPVHGPGPDMPFKAKGSPTADA